MKFGPHSHSFGNGRSFGRIASQFIRSFRAFQFCSFSKANKQTYTNTCILGRHCDPHGDGTVNSEQFRRVLEPISVGKFKVLIHKYFSKQDLFSFGICEHELHGAQILDKESEFGLDGAVHCVHVCVLVMRFCS